MNIAHVAVNFPPHIGGIGEVCFSEAHGLALRGHEVTVFSLRHGPESRSVTPLSKVRTIFLPGLIATDAGGLVPQLLWQLHGFDLIHLHYPFYGAAEWVMLAARLFKIPYVVTYHMDARPEEVWKNYLKAFYDRLWAKSILVRAERILAVDAHFFTTTNFAAALDPARVVELPNAVDTEIFYPAQPDYDLIKLEEWKDKKIVLFVGNLLPLKRVDILLQALAKLPEDMVGVVVGSGALLPTYVALAESLGIKKRVLFAGICRQQKKLAAYYRAATVVVVPSDYESFSLVTVEAQATGTIVIGSDIPGMRSKIIPGKSGFLFTPGSASMLARQLEIVCSLPRAEVQTITQLARQRVLERYTVPVHLDALEKIYRSVVERDSP